MFRIIGVGTYPRRSILFKIAKFLPNIYCHIFDMAIIIFWRFRRIWTKGHSRIWFLVLLLLLLFAIETVHGGSRPPNIEKQALKFIESTEILTSQINRNCKDNTKYTVYLIDNFDQDFHLVPEIEISHGDLLLAILRSGRDDISVIQLNTSLTKGLSRVVMDVANGVCANGIVSAIPGSNYSYSQISSLLDNRPAISEDNILFYKNDLLKSIKDIVYQGFPSAEWLMQIDVNSVKLMEDAKKIVLIEALGKFNLPIFLPYGNNDRSHRGEKRDINLLSLSTNAKVFSGLDVKNEPLTNYPYSPLSTGEEKARFDLIECPDHDNPMIAQLDINNDGYWDFSYQRNDFVAYYNMNGDHLFAPPVLLEQQFNLLADRVRETGKLPIESVVLTSYQYMQLLNYCTECSTLNNMALKELVWLNSERYEDAYTFNPQCRKRGNISGSSLIPPSKIKKLLVQQ